MKLVTFRRPNDGATACGVIADDGVVDATGLLPWPVSSSLKHILASGALPQLEQAVAGRAANFPLKGLELLPPIPDPDKIICAGVNYRTHLEETARAATAHPVLFARFADTQVGHEARAIKPAVSDKFDYEGELAVVIGATADAVPVETAMRHVAGYACYNDFSVRDWQRHTSQFLPGKNFKGTGAFGPYLVTADEIVDIRQSRLETRVNGDVRQSAPVADLIFSIEELISYISTFTILRPGDVIVTGTPGGVGLFRDPPEFLVPGDRVEVQIDGVGQLSNIVA